MKSRHARDYMRKLLRGYREYFGRGPALNSDGRRLLNDIVRELAKEGGELASIGRRVRRDPTLENVVKLARLMLGREADELLAEGAYGLLEGVEEG
ncbi:MAG: hypothetical protein B6U73_04820 [Desulfurococcales archaeon ex4484_204]|nr:MAG: hypothetical protein B6U73_04820 [Desulfurococcales archaeon ex4484_204]